MSKYEVLKRYLKLFFENNSLMSKIDAELIIRALEDEEEEIEML